MNSYLMINISNNYNNAFFVRDCVSLIKIDICVKIFTKALIL